MKMLVASAFAIGLGVMAMSPSRAMPIYPADKPAMSGITLVYGGCGPGWHRGPFGACRPLYNCPPGWHSGPYGRRCFRNY